MQFKIEPFGKSAKMRNCYSLYIGESQLTWSVGTLTAACQDLAWATSFGWTKGLTSNRSEACHGWAGRLQTYSELTHFDLMMTYFGWILGYWLPLRWTIRLAHSEQKKKNYYFHFCNTKSMQSWSKESKRKSSSLSLPTYIWYSKSQMKIMQNRIITSVWWKRTLHWMLGLILIWKWDFSQNF